MSHAEYHEWLLKIGMGWLGWTEADTLDTTMSGILLAYDGRADMLKAIFGGGDSDKGKTPTAKATPDKIRGALRMLGGGKKAGTGKPAPTSNRKGKPTA